MSTLSSLYLSFNILINYWNGSFLLVTTKEEVRLSLSFLRSVVPEKVCLVSRADAEG